MNDHDRDIDIDRRLRDLGASWQHENQERPGVDWERVTRPSRWRGWLAVGGVSVAAAAIVIPLVLTSGGHTTSAPTPATTPTPSPTGVVGSPRAGAPDGFFAIANGSATYIRDGANYGVHGEHSHPVAIGALPAGDTAYFASPASGCRTAIGKVAYNPRFQHGTGLVTNSDVTTISGSPAHTAMAVSPDGTKLALVAYASLFRGREALTCSSVVTQLVVVNVVTHSVRRWTLPSGGPGNIGSLTWSPDGVDVSLEDTFCPRGGSVPLAAGVDVVQTTSTAKSFRRAARNRHAVQCGFPGSAYFWRDGRLETILDGGLRMITDSGALGPVVAHGLPMNVTSVSSDPSGNHLLLSAGGTTYRWDNGVLSTVPGPMPDAGGTDPQWTQPGW